MKAHRGIPRRDDSGAAARELEAMGMEDALLRRRLLVANEAELRRSRIAEETERRRSRLQHKIEWQRYRAGLSTIRQRAAENREFYSARRPPLPAPAASPGRAEPRKRSAAAPLLAFERQEMIGASASTAQRGTARPHTAPPARPARGTAWPTADVDIVAQARRPRAGSAPRQRGQAEAEPPGCATTATWAKLHRQCMATVDGWDEVTQDPGVDEPEPALWNPYCRALPVLGGEFARLALAAAAMDRR